MRGRKPHDPQFDVRTGLYYLVGIDSTTIEGIDEIHALTLISELGTDFTKWPTVKHFASWAHICVDSVRVWDIVPARSASKGNPRKTPCRAANDASLSGEWRVVRRN